MDKDLKCFICGTLATAFFIMHSNPVCEICHEKLKNAPHAVEVRYPEGGDIENVYITGIFTTVTTSPSPSPSPSPSAIFSDDDV